MSSVFTLKLPPSLLERLDEASESLGRSKGEIVREALGALLQRKASSEELVQRITETHRLGRRPLLKTDWDALYRKTRIPTGVTPEEEVRRHRQRLR